MSSFSPGHVKTDAEKSMDDQFEKEAEDQAQQQAYNDILSLANGGTVANSTTAPDTTGKGGSKGKGTIANQGGITASQYLFNWGMGAAALGNFAGKTQMGNWGKLYFENPATSRVFMGNQFVKTLGLAKAGKALGIASATVGVGLDIRGMFIYRNNPNAGGAVSPGKFGADAFMTGIGFTGFGTLPAAVYFGIDAYYPGGFPAAMEHAAPL